MAQTLLRKILLVASAAIALQIIVLLSVGSASAYAATTQTAPAVSIDAVAPSQGGLLGTLTGRQAANATATAASANSTAAASTPTTTITVQPIDIVVVTPTPASTASPLTTTSAITTTASVTNTTGTVEADFSGAIEGTVIANRTASLVRFFVEGQTFELDPMRSIGLNLTRPTAVLNLFNCDATGGEAQEGCFWDPYLLQRDGFSEIVSGEDAGALVNLALRAAGAPPTNQIWIQNRTGRAEQVYFGTQMEALEPASVREFAVEEGAESVFYLRTCVDSSNGDVCEWTAHDTLPGTYYALVEETWQSAVPGATVTELALTPVLGAATEAGETTAPQVADATPAPGSIAPTTPTTATTATTTTTVATTAAQNSLTCTLAVPVLNVRSGPGLNFDVISKIMGSDTDAGSVTVTGRTEAADWLAVDERQANNGWIIAGDSYITCPSPVAGLPVIPLSALPATPTPSPVVETAPVETGGDGSAGEGGDTSDGSAEESTGAEQTAPASTAPAGLATLVVQNSFEMPIRFTLDQRYRVGDGPSETDLAPGQSVSFVVYPGVVSFSASSAWRSLSGNAEVLIEPDTSRTLYVIFVPDPGEPEKWIFQY